MEDHLCGACRADRDRAPADGLGAHAVLEPGVVVAAVLGVVVAAALWWVYFDVTAIAAERHLSNAAEGRERNEIARDSYSYLHFPMVAGIALIAVGMKQTLGAVDHPLEIVTATALLGGAAMYLLALLPAAVALPALATLGMLAALLVSLIAYEALRYAEARDKVRHQLVR